MISTDKKMFDPQSEVARRQVEYARKNNIVELHVIVFRKKDKNVAGEGATVSSSAVGQRRTGSGSEAGINFKFISDEVAIAPNVWVYSTRSKIKLAYPFDAIKLGRFIIERRGITHITTEDSSLTAMAGVSLKKQFKIPLEINMHTDIGAKYFPYNFENKIRKAMSLSYLPKADKVRVVSSRIKNYLVDTLGIDEAKITVRPIAVDVESIRNAAVTVDLHKKYPQFEKVVLMASRLEKEKNVDLAISAWPEVLKKIPRAGLVIVGSGSQIANLESQISKMGIEGSVVFEPWADKNTLASYYKTADTYLLTSLYEGYGLTLVEANVAGCKIVSTDVGVAREMGARIVDWTAESVSRGIIDSLL